jgi:uncharacterized membrane protein (UPF0127 family)
MRLQLIETGERVQNCLMKIPSWMQAVRFRTAPKRTSTVDARVQVKNLTRQAVLVDCLEIADSGAKRNKGLLGRKGLSPGDGLWIVPCQSVHTFGMQFSIDLVYLDRKRRIRKVQENVPPWRISVCFSAHSIIELPSGVIRETKSKAGDRLEFITTSVPGEDANGHSTKPSIGSTL